MKKILFLLSFVFLCLTTFSQTGNDTLKYTYYRYTYGEKFNRAWALNVLDFPTDTVYSKWGLSRKGTTVYVGNGIKWTAVNPPGGLFYTSNGTFSSDRTVSGSNTHALTFDSLNGYTVNSAYLQFNAINIGVNSTVVNQDNNAIQFSASNWAGAISTYGSFVQDSITFRAINGTTVQFSLAATTARLKGLPQANDSTAYKPMAVGTDGILKRMDGWLGGVGGGAPVVQTITAGPTVTINNSTDILQVNNTTLIASLTVTLPTTWPTNKIVRICFTANGTITSGNAMVTSFTLVNGSGQTLSQAINPNGTTFNAGENLEYILIGTVDQRLQ